MPTICQPYTIYLPQFIHNMPLIVIAPIAAKEAKEKGEKGASGKE